MKLINTDEAVRALMQDDPRKLVFSEALDVWRRSYYDGTIHLVTAPEVQYDVKSDRYVIKFESSGRKHSMKSTNAAAQFVLQTSISKSNAYYGFKLEDGVVTDVVAEYF